MMALPNIQTPRSPWYAQQADVLAAFPEINQAIINGDITAGQVDDLIIRAEDMADRIVGYNPPCNPKYFSLIPVTDQNYEEQWTLFPRLMDVNPTTGDPEIPFDIHRAALMIVDILFQEYYAPVINSAQNPSVPGITLNDIRDHGGSVKIHDFSIAFNGRRDKSTDRSSSSSTQMRAWLMETAKGRDVLAILDQYTHWTINRE